MTIDQQFDALDAKMAAKFQTLKHGTAIRFGILRVKQERRFDAVEFELWHDMVYGNPPASGQTVRFWDGSSRRLMVK